MIRRSRTGNAGFTLVEVMLTLLIMSGIMVMITQVLTGVRKTRDEIHNTQEQQSAGPAILRRLERDLRALFPFNRDEHFMLRIRDRVLAGLDADTIDFVCTVDGLFPVRDRSSEAFRHADVNEVGYHLRPRPDQDDFLELYRREDFGVDELPFQDGNFWMLHDRVKGFNIEVFMEDGPESEPLDGWDSDEDEEFVGLPARIEIELLIEMAPRLVREQLVIDRRTISYRRVFRFPESLRRAIGVQPKPRIPVIEPPTPPTAGGGAPGAGNPTGGDDPDNDAGGDDPNNPIGGAGGDDGDPFAAGDR